jgi:hypothetical protein
MAVHDMPERSIPAMPKDKELMLRYLAQAEDRAALGERLIAEQHIRIEQLGRAGRGVREAKALLAALEACQEWSASEIAARTELWHSIQNAVNDATAPISPVIDAYN